MATPNFVLTEEIQFWQSNKQEYMSLPAGLFVRPIYKYYVPKHAQDQWFNEERDEYCYTRFGIFVIPKNKIRCL